MLKIVCATEKRTPFFMFKRGNTLVVLRSPPALGLVLALGLMCIDVRRRSG